jgi:hypothetical protein
LATFFSTWDFDGSNFQPVKNTFKRFVIIFLFAVVAFGGCIYYFAPKPPKESKLIQNFNEHRADYEKLRDMLQVDTNLTRVASWGVETRKPVFLGNPPGGNFSVERYNEYLTLLKKVGGFVASRDEGEHPNFSIVVWGWGWAGFTKHVGICWKDEAPTNQIANVDDVYGTWMTNDNEERRVVFKHIDSNWYIWVDW